MLKTAMDFIIISLSSANAVSLGWLVQHDVIRQQSGHLGQAIDQDPLPLMMMELALVSWETISRRSAMISRSKC
jgi:hypothetical protein